MGIRIIGDSRVGPDVSRGSYSSISQQRKEYQQRGFKDSHPFPFGPWIQPSAQNLDLTLTKETLRRIYRLSSSVRPAVTFLVRTLSTTPWRIIADPGVPKRDFDFAVDLFTKPGPGAKTFRELLAKTLTDLFVLDEMYVEKIRVRGGNIIEFSPRDPATFGVIPGESGQVDGYEQRIINADGTEMEVVKFSEEDIMRVIMYPRTNSFMGTPVIEAIVDEVTALMLASQGLSAFFSDDELPQGLLHLGDIGTEAFKRAQADFENKKGLRAKRQLRTTFGRSEPRWIPFSRPFREMEIANIMPRVERIVFRNFGVTPLDLGMCHSADTETLTDSGWKHYWDIGADDKIGCYNPDTGNIEYHKPIQKFIYDFDGEMIHFNGQHLDCLVTPNHKMWTRKEIGYPDRGGISDYGPVKAGDMGSGHYKFLASVQHSGKEVKSFTLPGVERNDIGNLWKDIPDREIDMDEWLNFLGLFISEGSASDGPSEYAIQFGVSAGSEISNSISQSISSLPVNVYSTIVGERENFKGYISKASKRWKIHDKSLATWLVSNCGRYSYEKRLPKFIWALSKRQLQILFDALYEGDGYKSVSEDSIYGRYHTTSKQLADDFQLLAMKLGYRAMIKEYKNKTSTGNSEYVINICQRIEHHMRPDRGHRMSVPYIGKVYCFEVPHNLFLTRRNGKVMISHNSADVNRSTSEAFKEIRTFTLFKPILDLLAESFTFDILHEINEGLFLEFVHFSRTGQESDANSNLGTQDKPVDTDIPGEGEGEETDTSSVSKPVEKSEDRGYRSPLFNAFGMNESNGIICRPNIYYVEKVSPRIKRFNINDWSEKEILRYMANDSLRGYIDQVSEASNVMVSTILEESAEEIHDMVRSGATDKEIRALAEYTKGVISDNVRTNLRDVEAVTAEYMKTAADTSIGGTKAPSDGIMQQYDQKLQELVVDQMFETDIPKDEEAAFIRAFDADKLEVTDLVKGVAVECFKSGVKKK
jgi:hypothetical protein